MKARGGWDTADPCWKWVPVGRGVASPAVATQRGLTLVSYLADPTTMESILRFRGAKAAVLGGPTPPPPLPTPGPREIISLAPGWSALSLLPCLSPPDRVLLPNPPNPSTSPASPTLITKQGTRLPPSTLILISIITVAAPGAAALICLMQAPAPPPVPPAPGLTLWLLQGIQGLFSAPPVGLSCAPPPRPMLKSPLLEDDSLYRGH